MEEVNKIFNENCLETLKRIPEKSIQCVVTSPPYFQQRDYGVDSQIGLEKNPEEYIKALGEVFNEVLRVLKDDGICWVVIADSFAKENFGTIKKKESIGIPWMLAFHLRDIGWYVRQENIWNKLNSIPEPKIDRCTRSHESIFLLTKSERYYFNSEDIQYFVSEETQKRSQRGIGINKYSEFGSSANLSPPQENIKNLFPGEPTFDLEKPNTKGRDRSLGNRNGITGSLDRVYEKANRRSVWSFPTQNLKEKHFAAYPESIVELCILSGSKEGDLVYDPFGGSGTTAIVAHRLKRNWLLSEINPEYVKIAEKRIAPYLFQEIVRPQNLFQ